MAPAKAPAKAAPRSLERKDNLFQELLATARPAPTEEPAQPAPATRAGTPGEAARAPEAPPEPSESAASVEKHGLRLCSRGPDGKFVLFPGEEVRLERDAPLDRPCGWRRERRRSLTFTQNAWFSRFCVIVVEAMARFTG